MLLGTEDIVIRLLISFSVGLLMGFERYRSRKEAGMRTHAVVCVTATALTILSAYGFGEFADTRTMDPARLIVAMVTGIGFLGAGMIWKEKEGSIHGLTSAADILAVTTLGIAIGLGHYTLTAVTLALIMASLYIPLFYLRRQKSHNKAEENEKKYQGKIEESKGEENS